MQGITAVVIIALAIVLAHFITAWLGTKGVMPGNG